MAKLLEKNCSEMAAALVSIAAPIKNFLDDDEFMTEFRERTKDGVRNRATDILPVYSSLVPLLLGEKHLPDVLQILAVVEGKSVKEMLKMNGVDVLQDALVAWQTQIAPFFTRLGLSVQTK